MSRLKTLQPRLAAPGNPGGWKPDQERGNRHQRGYGRAWEKTRERILERDHGLCQPCKANGHVTHATQVDHITSKAEARAKCWTIHEIEADSNLQAICEPCHREKTSRESNRGAG